MSDKAKTHFGAGVDYLRGDDPMRYELAYREFVAAYAESPTWKIQGNLGITAHQLERYGEAIDALTAYLEEGQAELSPAEAAQVQRDLETLRAEHASVSLDVGQEPASIVDRREAGAEVIVNDYGPFEGLQTLRVRAGQHEFRLKRDGVVVASWKASLLPGDAARHVFDVPVAGSGTTSQTAPQGRKERFDQGSNSSATAAYWLWGFSAVGAGASLGMYLQANSVQNDADSNFRVLCPSGAIEGDPTCGPTSSGDERAAKWQTAALLTGIGSLGTLAAGTAIYWLRPSIPENEKSVGSVTLRPWVNSEQLGLSGTF